ncbi:hypothetical protein MAR_035858 [Mya arenaria]|uniref:Uncharacterized protein n=1 Tax=Mya arenaria TaxID=6604 RepID=A0ABY7EPA0_MYAAR|nr:hypothetical protein MAR_035858 [Mya arenaria]
MAKRSMKDLDNLKKSLELLNGIHLEPTRQGNLLDLTFTTNPTLIKTTTNVPGISDYDMVVIDSDIKPYVTNTKPRIFFNSTRRIGTL